MAAQWVPLLLRWRDQRSIWQAGCRRVVFLDVWPSSLILERSSSGKWALTCFRAPGRSSAMSDPDKAPSKCTRLFEALLEPKTVRKLIGAFGLILAALWATRHSTKWSLLLEYWRPLAGSALAILAAMWACRWCLWKWRWYGPELQLLKTLAARENDQLLPSFSLPKLLQLNNEQVHFHVERLLKYGVVSLSMEDLLFHERKQECISLTTKGRKECRRRGILSRMAVGLNDPERL